MSLRQTKECKKHLAECTVCRQQYEEQSALAISTVEILNRTAKIPDQIPEFIFPENNFTKRPGIIKISFWLKIAALLIPAIICWKIWLPQKTAPKYRPTPENVLTYELCNSVDANTAWQENMIITTVTNENGKVIECIGN